MNASRLREIAEKVVEVAKRERIGKLLGSVQSNVNALVSSPGDPATQQNVSQSIQSLNDGFSRFYSAFQPSEIERIRELKGGSEYFTNPANRITGWLSENAVTPAVVAESIAALVVARNAFFNNLETLATSLDSLGVEAHVLNPGEAEIGFLLPRHLFHNEFGSLLKELNEVKRIIRIFSEITVGTSEPINVHEISTTDPVFTLGLSIETVVAVGAAVTWAVNTWLNLEQIREIRAKAKKLDALREMEVQFDDAIRKTIETQVEKQTKHLLSGSTAELGRRNEQEAALTSALESILARVERGMQVEINFLPPVASDVEEGQEVSLSPSFQKAKELASELSFPSKSNDPILALPVYLKDEDGGSYNGSDTRNG